MKVIITAGGTGGHIYPALAIINKIKEKDKNAEFLYIGTHNRMEKDIVPSHGIPYEAIEIYGFSKKILKNFKTLKCIISSSKKCRKLIKGFKPDIVIGVGGYVTLPVVREAHRMGYKTFIHEQNSIPGKTNKYLSKFVDKIAISFKNTAEFLPKNKCVFTGNPCSENAINITPIKKEELGLNNKKKLVVIVMGSLGSTKINNFLLQTLSLFNEKEYEVLFITGKNNYDNFKCVNIPKNVVIKPYVESLTRLLKVTDIIVSRAGASTLSEIIALNLPSILIPSPYVANNHQYKNAIDLVNKEAAILLEEKNLKDDILIKTIDNLINDSSKMKKIKNNLDYFKINNSSTNIYNEIVKLIGESIK